jgi:hypothetical protein
MPCRWPESPLGEFQGIVRCRRRFGFPGRIDQHERVWLTFEGVDGEADISLNDHSLGTRNGEHGSFEFEVTALLRPRNELIVAIEDTSGRGGLWGEVAMEIRCLAWLKEVRARLVREHECIHLEVEGSLIGSAERPLDLYAVLGRSPVAYLQVEPRKTGERFLLRSAPLEQEAFALAKEVPVRVELVNGASAWFTVDTTVSSD